MELRATARAIRLATDPKGVSSATHASTRPGCFAVARRHRGLRVSSAGRHIDAGGEPSGVLTSDSGGIVGRAHRGHDGPRAFEQPSPGGFERPHDRSSVQQRQRLLTSCALRELQRDAAWLAASRVLDPLRRHDHVPYRHHVLDGARRAGTGVRRVVNLVPGKRDDRGSQGRGAQVGVGSGH